MSWRCPRCGPDKVREGETKSGPRKGQKYRYCATFLGVGLPDTNENGYCNLKPVQDQPAPNPGPSPAQDHSALPGANQWPSRGSLAIAALDAASRLGLQTPDQVIMAADRFLYSWLWPASEGKPTPIPMDGTQNS